MRKRAIYLLLLALFLGCVATLYLYTIKRQVDQTLAAERLRSTQKDRIPFTHRGLSPITAKGITLMQSTRSTRGLVEYKGSLFAATDGGLLQLSPDGKIQRHFTVLDGLPESDLTCMAVYNDRLFVGTRTKGLISFDGTNFESFTWTGIDPKAVTTMITANGRLLIGTFNAGSIEFDGESFTELKASGKSIPHVTSLFTDSGQLYIGTFDDGLHVRTAEGSQHFTTANGLRSNRVTGITSKGGDIYVATDLGLGILQSDSVQEIAVLPALSGIAVYNDRLFLIRDSGEVLTFDKSPREYGEVAGSGAARISVAADKLLLFCDSGIFEIGGGHIRPFGEKREDELTDNFVSSLAFDPVDDLWVGTFRSGIDVFSPGGRKRKHIESEEIREVNSFTVEDERLSAATSAGLIEFGSDLSLKTIVSKVTGLPSNSVMRSTSDAIATASGLAFRDGSKLRILSTVQGLPNNSVYSVIEARGRLYAGTLGGLAEIEDHRVARTFADSNSGLTTNWVTALVFTKERLFIGTYGGGVFELTPSGEIRSFEPETGKLTVNFNAMYSDGERLYVCTLNGVRVLDLVTQSWGSLRRELPSQTAMAVTGDSAAVYFGTNNGVVRIEKDYFKSGDRE